MKESEHIFRTAGAKQPPEPAQGVPTTASFIVRVWRRPSGALAGVVERVATGHKERFEGCEAVGAVISLMLAKEDGA